MKHTDAQFCISYMYKKVLLMVNLSFFYHLELWHCSFLTPYVNCCPNILTVVENKNGCPVVNLTKFLPFFQALWITTFPFFSIHGTLQCFFTIYFSCPLIFFGFFFQKRNVRQTDKLRLSQPLYMFILGTAQKTDCLPLKITKTFLKMPKISVYLGWNAIVWKL